MSRGIWHRTLVYLGLKEEPEFDQDELPERFVDEAGAAEEVVPVRPTPLTEEPVPANVHALHGDVHVRAVGSASVARAAVVEVFDFDDAEQIGSRYRTGQPVLFDVAGAPAGVARRIVDFVSGLTYASHGRLDKVGARAFLLAPDGVELTIEERRRLGDLGYELSTGSEA